MIPRLALLLGLATCHPATAAEEARDYPLGAIGGQYRIAAGESYARIVSLTAGAPGATAGLRVGDCLLGAFGKRFNPTGSYHYGVSQDLGFAVDRAEGNGGALPLTVLRPGVGGIDLTVNLPAVGAFGPAYPRKDAKYATMYESAVAWLHTAAMNGNGSLGYFTGWTGLALLGHPNWNDTTGAKPYRLSINRIRDSIVNELYNSNTAPNENLLLDGTANPNHAGGASNWQLGQKVMFLAEYRAKAGDTESVPIRVGGVAGTATVGQALQRGAEMCAASIQWWKQPAQHSNGFSPEYDRVAGMCSHGGVTGDYMHQGWYCGINITGVYSFNGMAFSRRAGANMASRPRDGHYFGFNLSPGDPIPASIANALPNSIALPKYGEDPVRGGTITDPFWYDMSLHQKFVMQLNFLARRSAWYSAGHNDDGMVGYAPEAITAYDAGGRTPGTLLGLAMYQQDLGGLDSADLARLESLKGYITRNYMRHQEAHAYCVGAQAYQALCAPYLSDRQQRFFMENWRFYFALSRTPTGGFQYFRSRGVADNYLDETHCAALNAALPYGIANGGYRLVPAYRADRLIARFDHPDQTWPRLEARALKVRNRSTSIPFRITDGDGAVLDPSSYTATWTTLGGSGAVSFGPGTVASDQALTLHNQSNPPDASNLPTNGQGNYRGFSLRPDDTAFSIAGAAALGSDTLLKSLTVRRSATAGSSTNPVYLKVYTTQTPSTSSWVGDSSNTANVGGGVSEANVTFTFNDLPLQTDRTYWFYFATTAGNQALASISWATGRLRVSNNAGHTYGSGNLLGTSWTTADSAYDAVFAAALASRTYSAPATGDNSLVFQADGTYRLQLAVTSGTNTLVEPIDLTVDTTPVAPQPTTMAFTAQPQAGSAAPGGSVTLSVSTSGPTPALYQWRRNGVAIGSPDTSPSLTLSNVSGGAVGDYDCIYTTALGTLTSATARVTVTGLGGSAAGGLWQEVFTGIGGDMVSDLASNAKFPWFADTSIALASAASTSNYADSYGQRWTGWITPPTSGDYRFYLASDDSSELWLGSSDLPSSATRILTLSGWTNEKQWSARTPSAWIPLQAGKRYYVELRHKEGGGGDHCALAWQRSGEAVPVNGSGQIPATVLSYRPGGIYPDVPLENLAPSFPTSPVTRPRAFQGSPYAASVAGAASDPNSTSTLTYSLGSGPAWLTVSPSGILSGTPGTADAGWNTWTLRATDEGGLTADAQLRIEVGPPNDVPDFTNPLVLPGAVALVPYSVNLADHATDADLATGDSLTFSKVSGPAWLTVASNGAVSGTPTPADSGTQMLYLKAVDSFGGEASATVNLVVGPPRFLYDPNGAIAGSGAATGGAWDNGARWTIDPEGVATAFAWVDGATPVFSAASDASGNYTVTNSAARTISGFIARSGRPLVTGGTLQPNAAGVPFAVESTALGARIDSVLTGTGGFTKTGPGTLILGGNNTFTGDLVVQEGLLELTSTAKLYNAGYNNTAVITVQSGATWRMPNFSYASIGQLADYAQRRVLQGGTIEITGATHSSGQNFTTAATGGTLRYTPSSQTLTLTGNGNSDLTLNGPLTLEAVGNITISETLAGSGSLTKTGVGNLVLNGTNTFTGPLTLAAGNLILDGANTENGSPLLTLQSGTLYLGTGFAGSAATFGGLAGGGAVSPAYGAATGTRTLAIQQAADTTYSGAIADASGARLAGLAKSGAGTLTLTGTSSYSGATTVSAGVLRVDGALGNTSTSVAATGTLAGSGRIAGGVTVAGALDPGGPGTGTLSTGALSLAAGSRLHWQVDDWTAGSGSGADSVNATSLQLTATASNPLTLFLKAANPIHFSETNRSFVLVQATSGIIGFDPAAIRIDTTAVQGPAGNWSVVVSGNQLLLQYARPNLAPAFHSTPLTLPKATVARAYAASLAPLASDPDAGESLTFRRVSGPGWLAVAPDGTLGGTPGADHVGPNAFVVEVSDAAGLTARADLVLEVLAATNPDGNANGILDAWELTRFGNAAVGANLPGDDPDRDGLVNLIEYAFDTDPRVPNPSPLACSLQSAGGLSSLRISLPKNPLATNLRYVVEACGAAWDWSAATVTLESDTADRMIARDTVATSAARGRFIRVRVIAEP